jgi:hypothetical protein
MFKDKITKAEILFWVGVGAVIGLFLFNITDANAQMSTTTVLVGGQYCTQIVNGPVVNIICPPK